MSQSTPKQPASRRKFLQDSSVAVVGGTLATAWATPAHAAGSDILKVGLIGCGGRGSGAAVNAMRAEPNVQLTAMADARFTALHLRGDDKLATLKKAAQSPHDIEAMPIRAFLKPGLTLFWSP